MKTLVAAVCIVVSSAVVAFAQPGLDVSAGRKITGNVYRWNTTHAYQSNAINHANALQYYAAQPGPVSKETAEEHAGEVRRNLSAVDKELAKLELTTKNDKAAADLIADIKTHQANALKACGMAEAECAKHNADGAALSSCCTHMTAELKAAAEAHAKLLKHLKLDTPVAAK
jgi:hypothetical protein